MLARIIAPVAEIRTEPVFESERESQRLLGDRVEVETDDKYGKYIPVNYPGTTGWIRRSHIELDESPASPNVIVAVPSVDCYFDDRTTLQTRLPFGTRIESLSRDNEWTSFKSVRGDVGWARSGAFMEISKIKYSPEDAIMRLGAFLGTPYLWGGISPYGTDCSGIIIAIARFYGHEGVPHSAGKQSKMGETITREEAQPMDLFYFPGHAAIYLGDNKIIHSNTLHGGVTIDPIATGQRDYNPVIEDLTVVKRFPVAAVQS